MTAKFKTGLGLTLAALLILFYAVSATATARPYGMERNEYLDYLRLHVNSQLMDRWGNGEVPLNSLADINNYLAVFDYWAQMAEEAKRHKLVEKEQLLLDAFKAKASAIQAAAFPQMRRALAGINPAEINKANITLTVTGANAAEITFSGTDFTAGAGPGFFSADLKTLLQRLRFKAASYTVSNNNGSRTETLQLESFGDGELAALNPATGAYRQVK